MPQAGLKILTFLPQLPKQLGCWQYHAVASFLQGSVPLLESLTGLFRQVPKGLHGRGQAREQTLREGNEQQGSSQSRRLHPDFPSGLLTDEHFSLLHTQEPSAPGANTGAVCNVLYSQTEPHQVPDDNKNPAKSLGETQMLRPAMLMGDAQLFFVLRFPSVPVTSYTRLAPSLLMTKDLRLEGR